MTTATVEKSSDASAGDLVPQWFTTHDTFVTQTGWRKLPESEACENLRVAWNPALGEAVVSGFPTTGVSDSQTLSILSNLARNSVVAREAHTRLARWEMNHPARLSSGLSYKQMSAELKVWDQFEWQMRDNQGMLPQWLQTGFAWFAEDGDPLEFGTPYLTHRSDGTPRWAVRCVGADKDMSSADWDDVAGIQGLVDLVLTHDAEAGATIATLSGDVAEARASAQAMERKRLALEAREVFARPKDRVKPRILEEVLQAEWNSLRGQIPSIAAENVSGSTCSVTVTETDVYGWRGGPSKPYNVAARLVITVSHAWAWRLSQRPQAEKDRDMEMTRTRVRENLPASMFDDLATAIDARVREARLGTLVRVVIPSDENLLAHYLVAKLPAEVAQYAAAFDYPDEAQFEVFRLGDDGALSWEPLSREKE